GTAATTGTGSPGCECPPAPASAAASSLISPPGLPAPDAAPSSRVACRSKTGAASASCDAPVWPAAFRGEIKEEASAVRRMPGDIRPERLPAAPGPPDREDPEASARPPQ